MSMFAFRAHAAKVYLESVDTTMTSTAWEPCRIRSCHSLRAASSSPQIGEKANGTNASTRAARGAASVR